MTPVMGERIPRREDAPLLTGEAKYIDDLAVPGAVHVALLRSPHAHARIRSIDTSEAQSCPGVVGVLTGADLREEWAGPLPCAWAVTEDMKNPAHFPVAVEKACYVGEAVAVVVADSKVAAKDALAAIEVNYEVLPAVIDLDDALSDRVVLHDDLGTNRAYTWDLKPDEAKVDEAFAGAAHVVKERYVQQRLVPSAMEPRGVCVVPAPYGGDYTVYSSTQVPHILKVMLGLTVGVGETKIRVIVPSVGGGFGSKLNVYAEEALCLALARRLRRPVRWTEERSENAQATTHGRGQIQEIELAADASGKVQAVRVRLLADMGAYLQLVTPGVPLLGGFLYHGGYDIGAYSFSCTSVFTTKTPTDAYRGAGRPEASYAIERAMDALARQMGIDPADIRRRNYIGPDRFPYETCAGLVYDSGNYVLTLDRALDLVDYEVLRKEQATRKQTGSTKHLGVGLSTYVEICGIGPSRVLAALRYGAGGWESATVALLPTGKAEVVTGTSPHGQGHETSWAQIVSDRFGIPVDDVDVLHSDTAVSPMGLDTYGSRSLAVGGAAVAMATDKVLAKALAIAAHQMEVGEDDLEFVNGSFSVKGSPDRTLPIQAVAFGAFTAHNLPDGMEPNLRAQVSFDPANFTFPFGTHACVVEVDEDTGKVDLVKYVAVDDCGNQVNPMIVEGQVHGGVVQGVAQALFEEAVYDEDGNLLTSTLADYLVPSAAEVPAVTTASTVTPTPSNPLGSKGVGEAGTIAAAQAVVNAIVDALAPFGVTDVRMPASPHRVWQAIQAAKERTA